VVEPDHGATRREQASRDMEADKSGGTGYEDGIVIRHCVRHRVQACTGELSKEGHAFNSRILRGKRPSTGSSCPRYILPAAMTLLQMHLRSTARRILPPGVRASLVRAYFRLETHLKGSLSKRFERRPGPIDAFEPFFPAREFAGGPIVLVNAGLGPGGVERQIVNTLLALSPRTDRKLGLLCLSFGADPELGFFLPALEGFSGFIRNATNVPDAHRALSALPAPAALPRIKRQIAWMPWDLR